MARVKQRRLSGHPSRSNQRGKADSTSPDPDGKKPSPRARVWPPEDNLRILEVLAEYLAKNGKVPDRSELCKVFENRGLKRAEPSTIQLYEKVRRLRERYQKVRDDGGPAAGDATEARKYELSAKIWGGLNQVSERGPLLRCHFPHLSNTVDGMATESSHGVLPAVLKRTYEFVDDEKAAKLEANIKKQKIKAARLSIHRAALTSEVFAELLEAQPKLPIPKKRVSERRAFEEMQGLFPHLSRTVDRIATESGPGMLPAVFKRAYELVGDDEAAKLEARINEQDTKAARLTMRWDMLVKELFTDLLGSMD